jgi:predicted porin
MEDQPMRMKKTQKPLLVALAACAAATSFGSSAFADDATNKALADQVKALMQRVEELSRQVDALKRPAPPPAVVVVPTPGAKMEVASAEPKFDKFLKGFYGTLDVSFDDVTKGINGLTAYHYSANPVAGPLHYGLYPDFTYTEGAPKGAQQVGRLGYLPSLSTNKSQIGYRGQHKIGGSDTDFIYQVETSLAITSSPGLRTSAYQQSNVVSGAIGLGDTFVGVQGKDWGKFKFGTTYAPYKKSTDRLNPFSGMLGDYTVVMGNTGGDNRVEFMTRLDHSLWYESPKFGNVFSFDVLFSPGQNRTYDNVVQSSGSPDCMGGNMPGSGNLLLRCDDGGFGNAFSVDVKFEIGGFYATAAYEIHKDVNRNSDGIGSNSPIYGYLTGPGTSGPNGVNAAAQAATAGIFDWGTYDTLVAEFPQYATVGGGTPGYLNDIGDEKAWKVGLQYAFPFGLTVSGIYEKMTRDVPAVLQFQNERERNGYWLALSQDIGPADNFAVGWAHAGRTPGDPGGQHNYDPRSTDNTANMFTAAWKHRFDKQLYWYFDTALTINHGNAHYDLGAGGRGLTTDCHDGTNTVYVDYSSAGPTTWGGCRVQGFSTGLNYKF